MFGGSLKFGLVLKGKILIKYLGLTGLLRILHLY